MPSPVGGSFRGCPVVWSISHHRGYCSRKSTVRPPHPCGWSCGASLLGRQLPPGLCTGSPVISCFHGSRQHLPWFLMQPSRAQTSGLGVPLLPLARWVGWVSPVPPTLGVQTVASCPLAALNACACADRWPTCRLFTGVHAVCVVRVLLVVVSLLLPPPKRIFLLSICFVVSCLFFSFLKNGKGGQVHTAGMGNSCSGARVLCSSVYVVGASVAAAPQGCSSRILMYTGRGQGGFR